MKVSSLLSGKQVQTIKPDATIQELTQALTALRIGALVVSRDGKIIDGIVSERDIVQALPIHFHKLEKLHVRAIMTVSVTTCTQDFSIAELMAIMTERRIRHIPVVDEFGMLISIVSIGDVVKSYVAEMDTERTALIDYVKSAN